jgi:hypothetical protein
MAVSQVKLQGNTYRDSRIRALVDGSGTFTVISGDSVEHSANADGSSPTTIALAATSGSITTRRYLRSLGRSTVQLNDGLLDVGVPL